MIGLHHALPSTHVLALSDEQRASYIVCIDPEHELMMSHITHFPGPIGSHGVIKQQWQQIMLNGFSSLMVHAPQLLCHLILLPHAEIC